MRSSSLEMGILIRVPGENLIIQAESHRRKDQEAESVEKTPESMITNINLARKILSLRTLFIGGKMASVVRSI